MQFASAGLTHEWDRSVFLTEFADNGSLDKHIQQHEEQPSFEQSLKWAKQVAQGTYVGTARVHKNGRLE